MVPATSWRRASSAGSLRLDGSTGTVDDTSQVWFAEADAASLHQRLLSALGLEHSRKTTLPEHRRVPLDGTRIGNRIAKTSSPRSSTDQEQLG
jgi:hypothetical protein